MRRMLVVVCLGLFLLVGCTIESTPPLVPSASEKPGSSSVPTVAPLVPDESESEPPTASEPPAESEAVPPESGYRFGGNPVEKILYLSLPDRMTVTDRLVEEEAEQIKKMLAELELLAKAPDAPQTGERVIAVFTSGNKQYLVLPAADAKSSVKTKIAAARWKRHQDDPDAARFAQWLTHLSPERLVAASGYTDRARLDELASFLQTEFTVTEKLGEYAGEINPNTPAGLFTLSLEFQGGVTYQLFTFGEYGELTDKGATFYLYASDLDRTVEYRAAVGKIGELRAMLRRWQLEDYAKNGAPSPENIRATSFSEVYYDDGANDNSLPILFRFSNESNGTIQIFAAYTTEKRTDDGSYASIEYGQPHRPSALEAFTVGMGETLEWELPFRLYRLADTTGEYRTTFTFENMDTHAQDTLTIPFQIAPLQRTPSDDPDAKENPAT